MFKLKTNTASCIFENQPNYGDSAIQLDLIRTGLSKVNWYKVKQNFLFHQED